MCWFDEVGFFVVLFFENVFFDFLVVFVFVIYSVFLSC